ncbi:MAG: hypothetical protein RQ743_11735 [Bacteroidales bacterium]|nr:hypothetical protein [Bacteroidales bacterium]
MNIRLLFYIVLSLLIFPAGVRAQGEEELRREVTLYNPFKPSLNKASKINFLPEISDTSLTVPEFHYMIYARPFMPEYEITTISAARLQPDPLAKLYKGFVNLGFGNYFSPLAELSISSDRSRKSRSGIYIGHESSFGKLKIDENLKAYGAYVDNKARLYTTRFFKRSSLDANINFNHIRRYAYGGVPDSLALAEVEKENLKIEYLNPRAEINYYSTRLDSSKIYYDIGLHYELLHQNKEYSQHLAGVTAELGYDVNIFYANLGLGYEFLTIPEIEDKFRHKVSIFPSISKKSTNWEYRLGVKFIADARYYYEQFVDYRTRIFFYPDLKLQFSIIPTVLNMYVGLDGDYKNNNASEIVYINPFIVKYVPGSPVEPSLNLYSILPSDTKLRVRGGITGHASLNTSYRLSASYSMFENMVFFKNDTLHGRGLVPVYDTGELLELKGGFISKINKELSLSAQAGYYNYTLEYLDEAWHKPSWEGSMIINYNLRDKIIAHADIHAISKRYAGLGPDPYTLAELPMNVSLSLGLEYRYTKILSFWARLNNIALERYYEWNYYPSQRFLFMAGFTYSL